MIVFLKKPMYTIYNIIKDEKIVESINASSKCILDASIRVTNIPGIVEISGKAAAEIPKSNYSYIDSNWNISYNLPKWWPMKEEEYEEELPMFIELWALFRTGKQTRTAKRMVGEESFFFDADVRFAIPTSEIEFISKLEQSNIEKEI